MGLLDGVTNAVKSAANAVNSITGGNNGGSNILSGLPGSGDDKLSIGNLLGNFTELLGSGTGNSITGGIGNLLGGAEGAAEGLGSAAPLGSIVSAGKGLYDLFNAGGSDFDGQDAINIAKAIMMIV